MEENFLNWTSANSGLFTAQNRCRVNNKLQLRLKAFKEALQNVHVPRYLQHRTHSTLKIIGTRESFIPIIIIIIVDCKMDGNYVSTNN